MVWERTVSSHVPMARTYIATVGPERHAILSTAEYIAASQSFLPEQPLKMETPWERVQAPERCRVTDWVPTDLLLALLDSISIAIVLREPPVELSMDYSFAGFKLWLMDGGII